MSIKQLAVTNSTGTLNNGLNNVLATDHNSIGNIILLGNYVDVSSNVRSVGLDRER